MKIVIVIDDNKQVRDMLRMILENEGYEVLDAPNGELGIRMYRANPGAVVITDLIMPVKDGLELIIEIQQDFPNAKIIAISGGGMLIAEECLEPARTFGALRTFAKPFGLGEMLDAVKELAMIA